MATTKTPTPEYDFDSWSDEDEEKAIAAAVPDVKYIVVERRFIGRFTNGEIVEVPLSLSLDDVEALQEEHDAAVDQFKMLLRIVGGDDVANVFGRQDLVEAAIMAEKYFRVLQRIQQAAFPES
ncbi:hypothetical protein [Microbacterium sp. PAMC21962]|uniref:hypothetical protein n=1 Tax=Microbacterium sp. PAMC21962 TaxID=2861280 RepID=UPI001C630C3B|nr:hypothetical protein [Microbacterium sp. PAMC21962]QYF98907.1 hypothetical protein KY498_06755 [Microbacterium sp. PAMC21962]